jgi:hypothetical protein
VGLFCVERKSKMAVTKKHWNDFLYKSEIQDGHHCRTLFIGPYVNINEIIF